MSVCSSSAHEYTLKKAVPEKKCGEKFVFRQLPRPWIYTPPCLLAVVVIIQNVTEEEVPPRVIFVP